MWEPAASLSSACGEMDQRHRSENGNMRRILFVLGFVCVSTASATTIPYQTPVTLSTFKTDTTIIGQKIEVPKNPTVVFSTAVFAPGARTPVHKHLYPHYVYIQDGMLTIVNTQTGKSYDIKAGTFFPEMMDTWHYGINNGKVPVHLLVIDQIPNGVKTNTVPKDAKEGTDWYAR